MCPHDDDILKGKQNVTQTDIQGDSITLADLWNDRRRFWFYATYFSIYKDFLLHMRQLWTLYQAGIFKFQFRKSVRKK
jgi:hypothetical protein